MQNEIKKQLTSRYESRIKTVHNFKPSLNLTDLDIKEVLALKQLYQQKIRHPISMIQAIQYQKMPQKCLSHSTDYSLYCHHDKRPLCVSCVHKHQNRHLGHKVTPLKISTQNIQNDIIRFRDSSTSAKLQIEHKISQINSGISQIDDKLSQLQEKTNVEFKKIHTLLYKHQQTVLQELSQYYYKNKYELIVLSGNLKIISDYIGGVVQKYGKPNSCSILASRNILGVVECSDKLIKDQLGDKKYLSSLQLKMEYFSDLQRSIIGQLEALVKKLGKQKRGSGTDRKKSRLTANRLSGNMLAYSPSRSQSSITNNRHSKSISSFAGNHWK